MNRPLLSRLVLKDLYLYRWMVVAASVLGVGSLALSGTTLDDVGAGADIGLMIFISTVVAFGIFVALIGVLKEHQDGTKLFVLSLPVSAAHYAVAKVTAALLAFLAPWLLFTLGVVGVTLTTGRPSGGLPFFVLMMLFFLANFCLLLATSVITRSEVWTIACVVVTNTMIPVFLAMVGRLVDAAGRSSESVALWSLEFSVVAGVEVAVILLALTLSFILPPRRRDFL